MMTSITPCAPRTPRAASGVPASDSTLRIAEAGLRATVRTCEPVDVETTDAFLARIRPLCEPGRRLLIDLRRAPYIDSTGIRGLLVLKAELEEKEGELRLLVDPGSRVERALRLLRLEQHFGIGREDAAAMQAA